MEGSQYGDLIDESCHYFDTLYWGKAFSRSFTIELEENNPEANYVYVSSLRDYVQKEKAFDVPQTLSIDVEMNQPRGLLGWLVRRGHMSTEIYGEDWPFIVKEGTLNCLPVEQAVFETSEGTYALNEAAEGEFPVIDMLVAPEVYDDYAAGGIDIAWLTDRALQFCD